MFINNLNNEKTTRYLNVTVVCTCWHTCLSASTSCRGISRQWTPNYTYKVHLIKVHEQLILIKKSTKQHTCVFKLF